MNFEKPSLTKDVFTTASNRTEPTTNRLSNGQLQDIVDLYPDSTHAQLAAELLSARKQIAELDRLSAENATFREWIDRSGDTFTRMHAENANLRDELEGAVRLPCRCKNCEFGTLDKAMSSPVNGWMYACEWNRNYWRSGDGFCSSGKPRAKAGKAREDI